MKLKIRKTTKYKLFFFKYTIQLTNIDKVFNHTQERATIMKTKSKYCSVTLIDNNLGAFYKYTGTDNIYLNTMLIQSYQPL